MLFIRDENPPEEEDVKPVLRVERAKPPRRFLSMSRITMLLPFLGNAPSDPLPLDQWLQVHRVS